VSAVQVLMDKADALEVRVKSVDDWAGEAAYKPDPDALWEGMT